MAIPLILIMSTMAQTQVRCHFGGKNLNNVIV